MGSGFGVGSALNEASKIGVVDKKYLVAIYRCSIDFCLHQATTTTTLVEVFALGFLMNNRLKSVDASLRRKNDG